jgi:hypothetical protein
VPRSLLIRLARGQTRASQVPLRGAPALPSHLSFITLYNVIEHVYGWRLGRSMIGDFRTHIHLHRNRHCEGYMYGWRNVMYRRERGTLLLTPPADGDRKSHTESEIANRLGYCDLESDIAIWNRISRFGIGYRDLESEISKRNWKSRIGSEFTNRIGNRESNRKSKIRFVGNR